MYSHTQRGGVLLIVLLLAGLVPVAFLSLGPGARVGALPRIVLIAVMVLMLLIGIGFSSLTIRVGDDHLTWFFGRGLFRKTMPLAAIAGAVPTTTSFIEGWGIHLTFRGWLYNVAGRRAVLITRTDGTTFMLGSDEPEKLIAAIESERGRAA
jgi:hypothetical protein